MPPPILAAPSGTAPNAPLIILAILDELDASEPIALLPKPAAAAFARGTITIDEVPGDDTTVGIGPNGYRWRNMASALPQIQVDEESTPEAEALKLASAINAYDSQVSATANGPTILVTAKVIGEAGNSIPILLDGPFSAPTTTLTGGVNPLAPPTKIIL